MRKKREFSNLLTRNFLPEMVVCIECKTKLRRFATLSYKTVITLEGPLYAVHKGYRCPNPECEGAKRVYRSAACDALALPGFTFGLDVIALVGHLKLARHQTLDEVHQNLCEKLGLFGLTISRREVLYLFEAYAQLLRCAAQPHAALDADPAWHKWLAQVKTNGGLIVSIDGIQPDKGNETIYLVRDVLTGRVLNAQNVTSSDTATLVKVLRPIADLGLPVLGAISDAQISEILAIQELWPKVPHQTCQFHYLREAARPIFDLDRSVRAAMRKDIQNKVRDSRKNWPKQLEQLKGLTASPDRDLDVAAAVSQGEQLEILNDYATSIVTALNLEGNLPFVYPAVEGAAALAQIETSLGKLSTGESKKGI